MDSDEERVIVTPGGARLHFNPGSGPVAEADIADALSNIEGFIGDLGLEGVAYQTRDEGHERGRFAFVPRYGERASEILMPGIALERVRYMAEPGQRVFDFPRLYVDGSSWVRMFGLDAARDHLTGSQDGEEKPERERPPLDLTPVEPRCEWAETPGGPVCGRPAHATVEAANRYDGHYCRAHIDLALRRDWPEPGPFGSHVRYY